VGGKHLYWSLSLQRSFGKSEWKSLHRSYNSNIPTLSETKLWH
jgi:hypothetical protein